MAFWNSKQSEYETLAQLIEAQQGTRVRAVAAQLGVHC